MCGIFCNQYNFEDVSYLVLIRTYYEHGSRKTKLSNIGRFLIEVLVLVTVFVFKYPCNVTIRR